MTRTVHGLLTLALAACLASLAPPPAGAADPGPLQVTSLHTEIFGTVLNSPPDPICPEEAVELTGQLHVVSRMRVDGTGALSGDVYLNLHGVEGIGTSGVRYLGIGAAQVQVQAGPPDPIRPPVTVPLDFTLQSVGHPPNPCITDPGMLPVSVTLTFDETGALTEAVAVIGGRSGQ